MENDRQTELPLRFQLATQRPTAPASANELVGILVRDNWDDFHYKTTFDLYISLPQWPRPQHAGAVKIMHLQQEEGKPTPMPGGNFKELSDAYISLGQQYSYYEFLDKLPSEPDAVTQILQSLKDAVFNSGRVEHFSRHPAWERSLLREPAARRTLNDARALFATQREAKSHESPAHIFVSFSHEDEDYVGQLVDRLTRHGIKVWFDSEIDYGDSWPDVIERHLDNSAALLLIMSMASKQSLWVKNELVRAQRKRIPIFPILLSGDIWLELETTQYLDLRAGEWPPSRFYKRLKRATETPTAARELAPLTRDHGLDIASAISDPVRIVAPDRSKRMGPDIAEAQKELERLTQDDYHSTAEPRRRDGTVGHKCFISYDLIDAPEVLDFVKSFESVFIPRVVGLSAQDGPLIESDDADYIHDTIRDKYLCDSTVTIVMVGRCTWARRFVDNEIYSSLRSGTTNLANGLMAIELRGVAGTPKLPSRVADNYSKDSESYAEYWKYPSSEASLQQWIKQAFDARTSKVDLINNARPRRKRNSPCE